MKSFCIVLILEALTACILAQNKVDIRLTPADRIQSANCYDIELRSPYGQDIMLAGQNYRLFYNSDKVEYLKSALHSYLDARAYSKIDLINTQTNNIGFLSISVDGRELGKNTVKLEHSGEWERVMNICFKKLEDSEMDLTWADGEKTWQFATAQVALSEWVNNKRQQILHWNVLESIKPGQTDLSANSTVDLTYYPNPTADIINIEIMTGASELSHLIIKDVIGREMVYDKIQNRTTLSYDMLNWPSGSYTLEMFDKDNRRIRKEKLLKISL